MLLLETEFYVLFAHFAHGQDAITRVLAEANAIMHLIEPTHDLFTVLAIRDTVQDMSLIFATVASACGDIGVIVPDDVANVLLRRVRESLSAAYCFVRTIVYSMHLAGLETSVVEERLADFNYHFEQLRDALHQPAPILAN